MNVLDKHNNRIAHGNRIKLLKNTIFGVDPTSKQQQILDTTERSISFDFGRQEGCSTAACIKAIDYAFDNCNSEIIILSPAVRTSIYKYDTCLEMIERVNEQTDILDMQIKNGSNLSITLKNGSRISFKGTSSLDSIRGCRADLIVIDKFNTSNEYTLEIAHLMTASRDGQVIMLNQG